MSGDEVFGSLSTSVQGTADLNPVVTEATRIDDLHGGLGIAHGSILISDGTSTSNIDLSRAHIVGDVLRLIEANPPGVNSITATVTSQGIRLELGSGTITVRNIGGGTTASDLGILEEAGNPSGVVDGQDLNPRLTLTTELRDILGSRAKTRAISSGANNDLQIEADIRGTGFNGVTVSFVDNPAMAGGGDEIATYDAVAGTLIIEIREGVTIANDIVTLLDGDPDFDANGGEEVIAGANVNPQEVSGIFTALLRLHDALLANNQNEITRAVDMLDESRDDLNFTLAEIGARQQGLGVVQFRLETEEVELRASLSDEIDVDLTEAITNLTARQIAIEASL